MRTRHFRLSLTVLLAFSLIATACSTETRRADRPQAPTEVAVLRLAGGQWGYPTPFAYSRGPGLAHMSLVYDSLLWKDTTGAIIPWLAASWSRDPAGTEWRFELRPNLLWQDGRPLTADDVVFTFDYLTAGAGRAAGSGVVGPVEITEVVAESPTSVVLRLARPYAPFEETVAGRTPILPRHQWESVADPIQFRDPLIGSGPYRLEKYDEATGSYLYAANESYFLGPPFVKRIEYVPAPNEVLAASRGDVDAAFVGVASAFEDAIPEAMLNQFKEPGFGMITAPGEWNRAIHFNLTKGFPYNEKRFRQAFAYAIDRHDLVGRILLGRGEPGSLGGLAPSNPYAAKDLPAYAPDAARARALLDEIGLRDVDGDGLRELPDGRPFTIVAQTNSRFSAKTPELVKEYLRAVGINMEIASLDQNAADAATTEGNYEVAFIGYGGMGGEPDTLRTRLSGTLRSRGFSRVYGWNNPRFEELATAQLAAPDVDARKAMVAEMQQLVAEDLPLISLYLPTRMTLFRSSVFDGWRWTQGGIFGSYPGPNNKLLYLNPIR